MTKGFASNLCRATRLHARFKETAQELVLLTQQGRSLRGEVERLPIDGGQALQQVRQISKQ